MTGDDPRPKLSDRLKSFNPFLNESDMFRVLIAVVVLCAVVTGVVVVLRAIL